jgi:hypothetical protein
MSKFDIVVIGGGPAGIGAVMELIERDPSLKILMLEKGKPIEQRGTKGIELTQGWGGSSGYSDNKCIYSLDSNYGGRLQDYIKDMSYFSHLMQKTDDLMMRFSPDKDIKTYGDDEDKTEPLRLRAARHGILLMGAKIKHYGTDLGQVIFKNMYEFLKDKVEIRFNTEVIDFNKTDDGFEVFDKSEGYSCKHLILAVGRGGNKWFGDISKKKGIQTKAGRIDLGVRVEFGAHVGKEIDSVVYEPKCVVRLPNDVSARTFCYCPNGKIAVESVRDGDIEYTTVNGHSDHAPEKKTRNTNFCLLVSSEFDQPFNDPIAYGRSVVRLANLLGGGKPIVQRLKDIKAGRRSTEKRMSEMNLQLTLPEAVPGDLSLVFPAKIFNAINDSLKILDNFMPGLYGDDVALYGVEAKWFSIAALLKPSLESVDINDLYCVGDGSGCTRSEVQAFMSGFVAANSILNKIGKK